MNKNYYVYIHTINDEVLFYIGKGTGNRAWVHNGRTKAWMDLVQQNNNNYTIEILADNLSEQTALCLEAALIKVVGIKHLVNKKQKITKK
jgi:hypothetical protein